MKVYQRKMLRKLRIALIIDSKKRTDYIIKKNIFHSVGNNFFFQPRIIPSDPELIKFHNNVTVTSGVTFVTHDVFNIGLNNIKNGLFNYNMGCIEVMDNVFIGCNSIVLSNVRIGPNVVIAAGSVVTKDIEPGTVVAGNPAKVIGTFEDFSNKRLNIDNNGNIDYLWEKFYSEKGHID